MRSCSFNVRFKLSTILYKSDEYLIRVVDRTSIFLSMKNSSVTQKFLIIEERNAVTIRVHSLQPLLHHPSIIAGHVQQKRFQVENRYILYTRSKKNKIPPTHIFYAWSLHALQAYFSFQFYSIGRSFNCSNNSSRGPS